VQMMNTYAKELGMTGSNFTNSAGMPSPEHYMTARDAAIMSSALIREFPEYYKLVFAEGEFVWNGITQQNRNGLLWRDPTVDGVKTGHTESAGYCLITSSARDGMRLVSVVLGTESMRAREDASAALLGYAFNFFETKRVYAAGRRAHDRARVERTSRTEVGLTVQPRSLHHEPARARQQRSRQTSNCPIRMVAPLSKSTAIGQGERGGRRRRPSQHLRALSRRRTDRPAGRLRRTRVGRPCGCWFH
jgi:serine-type D-Ala-D-Ala carboxypeptidase (penicillin-binding protein 5/6)